MSEQRHQQHDTQHSAVHGPGGSEEELGQQWAVFRAARARLAEVMSDDELRGLGINLEVLDERL